MASIRERISGSPVPSPILRQCYHCPVTEVRLDPEDRTTTQLARAEIVATILVQLATVYLALSAMDDGTTWPTILWHWRRFRYRLRGAIEFRVPAWPVIAEAEKIVREGAFHG